MTSLVGILCVESYQSFFAERYFREIVTVASQTLVPHDCYVRIMPALAPGVEPAAVAEQLRAHGVSAALVVAPDEAFVQQLALAMDAIPSIIISAPRLDMPYSYVNSDNYAALGQIVAHLAGLGHRRIRLMLPLDPSGDYLERRRGYADAVGRLGLGSEITTLTYPIDDGLVDRVLADRPDALIMPDDQDALALLSRLKRRGVRVPEDLALVGFDDEDFAAETLPALTTVSQPLGDMARRATQFLVARLGGREQGLYQEVLPNRLIVRESCGARLPR